MIYKFRDSVRIAIGIFWFTCLNLYTGHETWGFVDIFLSQFQIEWSEKKFTGDIGDTKALKIQQIQCGPTRHSSSSLVSCTLVNPAGEKTFTGSFCTGTTSMFWEKSKHTGAADNGGALGQLKWHKSPGIHPPLNGTDTSPSYVQEKYKSYGYKWQ